MVQPLYGLPGTEQALMGGQQDANRLLREGHSLTDRRLLEMAHGGYDATKRLADMTGSQGPEAQARFYQNYQAGPEQQYLQDQAVKLAQRGAGQRGVSGTMFKELLREGAGLASQDINNAYNRLSGVADRSLAARQAQANALQQNYGQRAQNIMQAAGSVGQARYGTGQQLAGIAAQEGSQQANLLASQGANLANIIREAGGSDADVQRGLAQLLGNASIGEGTTLAGLQTQIGRAQAAGGLAQSQAYGQTLGALGNILADQYGQQNTGNQWGAQNLNYGQGVA